MAFCASQSCLLFQKLTKVDRHIWVLVHFWTIEVMFTLWRPRESCILYGDVFPRTVLSVKLESFQEEKIAKIGGVLLVMNPYSLRINVFFHRSRFSLRLTQGELQ